MRFTQLAVLGVTFLCAGCTTELETKQGLPPAALSSAPLDGAKGKLQLLSYSIPAAQFDITIKSRPATCQMGQVENSEIQATIATQYNPGEHYSIDYDALASWTKITSMSTDLFPNGTLKSINAEVSDQTIETATAIVKFAASIAAFAGKAAGGPADPACAALTKRHTDEAPLKAAQDALDKQIAALLAAKVADDSADAVGKKLDALQKLRDAIATKIAAIDGAGWVSNDAMWPVHTTDPVSLNTAAQVKVGPLEGLYVVLTRVDQPSATAETFAAPPALPDGAPYPGLVWRQSYMAKLSLVWCGDGLDPKDVKLDTLTVCPVAGGTLVDGKILTTTTTQVPQAGPYILIPLKNGMGKDSVIGATFLADGTIASASYGDKVAGAAHIIGGANDAATAAASLKGPDLTTKLTAQKACLDAVTGLRTSEATAADALGGNSTDPAKFSAYAAKCME